MQVKEVREVREVREGVYEEEFTIIRSGKMNTRIPCGVGRIC